MLDLNVRVAVRTRPMSSTELARGCLSCITTLQAKHQIQIENLTMKNGRNSSESAKLFTFDHAYDESSLQQEVYTDLGAPLVSRALDGYNGTIFAYGQTGSGKTWSMMGVPDNEGIIPSLNRDLYERIKSITSTSTESNKIQFLVTVSYIEIYNEIIHDLLNPSEKQLELREDPTKGVFISGVCEVITKDRESLNKLVTQGNSIRRVAETKMNSASSRSHSVFTIKVEKRTVTTDEETKKEVLLTSKLNLIDLAGSERADKTGATGSTLKEGAAINKSLMSLGNVINALGEVSKGKAKFVPYRDSKLTRLLQESLGGNSSTLMLAALSPADYNHDETLSTLNYAKRAKLIKNKMEKNEDVKEKEIRKLKEEIEELRKASEQGGGGGGGGGEGGGGNATASPAQDPELVAKLAELQSNQNESWEERAKLSAELEKERQNNINSTMGSVIDSIKEKKMLTMKAIKKAQHSKAKLVKSYRDLQQNFADLKKLLDTEMKEYQAKQTEFESMADSPDKDRVEEELASLLDKIEQGRTELVQKRADMLQIKKDSEELEDSIIAQRAELVANADLLSQNDNLRKAIQKEEMEKMEAMKEDFLKNELEKERSKMELERQQMKNDKGANRKDMILRLGKMQADANKEKSQVETVLQNQVEMLSNEKSQLESELDKLQLRFEEMENRVVEAESLVEEQNEEITGLRELASREKEKSNTSRNLLHRSLTSQKLERVEDEMEDFGMFARMMNGFEEERRIMEQRNAELKLLLKAALLDLNFLAQSKVY